MSARFGIGVSTVNYTSSLAAFEELKLVSKPSQQLSEVWTTECSPFVVCDVEGLAPTFSVTEGRDRSIWYPFPGDEVRIQLKPLVGSPGETLTVDSVQHVSSWGSTMLGGAIDVQLRATQQSTFNLSLPPGSRLKGTTLDGQSGREVMQDNALSFLLAPGAHAINVGYEVDWQAQLREVVPSITVDAPTNNLTVVVRPSADRWLLWVGGLQWGPAVLFWAKLVFVAAISLFLVRINALPLSRVSAVLLSIGLTTLPTYLLLIPLAWLVSLNLLPRCRDRLAWCKPMAISVVFGGLTLVSLTLLYEAVRFGLVIQPPMLIVGNQSNAEVLRWYVDHATSTLPQPWVISLPMWCWRAMMLLWSTWLAVSVVSWLRKALRAFQTIHHGASKIAEATAPDNA
ncbi:MAG: hypothetical protein IT290_11035 [Deltaproteobacteria bacterium]|nr:hypothetical protein [Deltaproteobacteria bacterium]